MAKSRFRHAYDGLRHGVDDVNFSDDPGHTRQAHKDECDINRIMDRFQKSGLLSHVNQFQGEYGEFIEMDFHEAMNTILEAKDMFETVPSDIREKFNNDPGKFLEYVTNPENVDGMRELGLLPTESTHPSVPKPAAETVAPAPKPPENPPEDATTPGPAAT